MKVITYILLLACTLSQAEPSFPNLSQNNPELVTAGYWGPASPIDRERLSRVLEGTWTTVMFGKESPEEFNELILKVDSDLNCVLSGSTNVHDSPFQSADMPIQGKFLIIDAESSGEMLVIVGIFQNIDGWEQRNFSVSLTETEMVIWLGDPPWVLKKSKASPDPEQ